MSKDVDSEFDDVKTAPDGRSLPRMSGDPEYESYQVHGIGDPNVDHGLGEMQNDLPGDPGSNTWAQAEADRLISLAQDYSDGQSHEQDRSVALLWWKRVEDKILGS